jgi:hypothetical protein
LIKRKKGKDSLSQDVVATNRWGCGCITIILFGIVAAMLVAGYMQTP